MRLLFACYMCDTAETTKDLELCISKFPDTHLEHHSLCSSHALSDKQDKASVLDSCVRCNKLFDHKSESTKNRKLDHSENLITLLANDGNKSTESRAIEPPTDMSNVSRNKVPASSGSRTSLDFCLKGQESAENVKTATLDGTNVLRHSDLSAFSKYNCASSDSQAPTAKVGSCSPPDNSSYALKTGMMPNSQSISAFKCFQASAAQQVEHTCLPPSTKNDGTTPGKEEAHAKDSDQQFVQHHHHHYHHYHHHVQELHPQAKEDHEGYLMTNQMVDASRCGSSNMLDGHVEGNATFRNLVGSDNNRASIGRNGSSNESNVGVTNMESDNGEKVNSGVNSINQGANGGGANKDCSSQREAALKKFRQKRKERCFEKKVRYQSRKKLAEQRPRIRGQFVRTESDDKAGIEKQDNLLLKDGSSNSIE